MAWLVGAVRWLPGPPLALPGGAAFRRLRRGPQAQRTWSQVF